MANPISVNQLEKIVKNQLMYEKNYEIREISEFIKEIPFKAIKNIGISTALGTTITLGSSLFIFRNIEAVKNDLNQILPVLGVFSSIDFSINYSLTKSFYFFFIN